MFLTRNTESTESTVKNEGKAAEVDLLAQKVVAMNEGGARKKEKKRRRGQLQEETGATEERHEQQVRF